jgi:hypothetical protein
VESSRTDIPDYSDWVTGVDLSYPLVEFIRLYVSSSYSVRSNEETDNEALAEEYLYDYNTWRTRLGTGFNVTESVKFNTYVQRLTRTSDSANLDYERDTFAATFTYSHQF